MLLWRRGDICRCNLGERRPVVILTRDALIAHLSNVTVAPLTTCVRSSPSQVILKPLGSMTERCAGAPRQQLRCYSDCAQGKSGGVYDVSAAIPGQ